MEQNFPTFDMFSSPLLILLVQGLLFAFLILLRYRREKYVPDLILAIFLLLFCYEKIHYTIGFLAWYDSFPNTKINYFLFPMTLAIGPVLFFYVKSITNGKFTFKRKYLLHLAPFFIYLFYRAFIFLYDLRQSGFVETQNGVLMSKLEIVIVNPLLIVASSFHLILYLAFTIQFFWLYKRQIKSFYSNTYALELNWVRNFLIIYLLLFAYEVFQNITDSFIVELYWTQKWWFHLISSAAILYFGINGYYTRTSKLHDANFKFSLGEASLSVDDNSQNEREYDDDKERILAFMSSEKPYLDPNLNLTEFASKLKMSNTQLSDVINNGIGMNFNDFINSYRVEAVKSKLTEGQHKGLSLVGIAFDCGFNSKATFNRVFKKLTHQSPSEFIEKINK